MGFIESELTGMELEEARLGRGELYIPETLPEYIHIFANWGNAYNFSYIVLSTSTTQTSKVVRFGESEMYPIFFRENASGFDYVSVIPGMSYSNNETVFNYCYAIEIIMTIKRNRNGTFTGYEGAGSFTMAYNNNAHVTGIYVPLDYTKELGHAVFPTELYVNNETRTGRFYLQGILSDKGPSGSYNFVINILDFNDAKFLPIPILNCKISADSIASLSGNYTSSNLRAMVNSPNSIITDLQIILPDEEKDKSRKEIINYFAFDYELLNQIIVDPNMFNSQVSGDWKNVRTYAIREGSDLVVSANTDHIIIDQPVYVNVALNYDVTYSKETYTITSSNAASNIITSSGQNIGIGKGVEIRPQLIFSPSGSYQAGGTITGNIHWTYDCTRDRNSTTYSDLVGTMVVNSVDWVDPESLIWSGGTSGRYQSNRPYIDLSRTPVWWKSATNSKISDIYENNIYNATLKIENFGLIASYVFVCRRHSAYSTLAERYQGKSRLTNPPSYGYIGGPVNPGSFVISTPDSLEFLTIIGYQKTTIGSSSNYYQTISSSFNIIPTPPLIINSGISNTALLAASPTSGYGQNILDIMKLITSCTVYYIPCDLLAKINGTVLVGAGVSPATWNNTTLTGPVPPWDFTTSYFLRLFQRTGVFINKELGT